MTGRPPGRAAAWALRLLAGCGLCWIYACTQTDVTGVLVETVTVSPESATLLVGETLPFSVAVRDVDGTVVPSSIVTWSTVDEEVASVASDGRLTALAAGSTQLRATARGVTGTASVTVQPGPTIGVSVESVSFLARRGAPDPDPFEVAIENAGNGVLSGISASTTYAANGPTGWLALELSSTTAPAKLTLSVATGTLATGSYGATVTLRAPSASSDVELQVELRVSESHPVLRLSPAAVGFAGVAGASPPTAQVVQVTNEGDGQITGLTASVDYAGGDGWLTAELASGTTPTTLTLTADPAHLSPGSYAAAVEVSSPAVADAPRSVNVSFTVDDEPLADLGVEMAGPAEIVEGDSAVFVIAVANAGPRDAVSVVLVDSLPQEVVTFARASGEGQLAGGAVTWPARILAAGTTVMDTVWVVGADLGSAINVARVSSVTIDPSSGNDRAESRFTTVSQPADLSLTKIGPATAEAGDEISYVLDVAYEEGTVAAQGVRITDVLPASLSFVSATGEGSYDAATRSVSWSLDDIPIGGSATVRLTARVAATAFGSIQNAATVTTATRDPNGTNNVGSEVTAVTGTVDLAVTKSGPASASAGTRITNRIEVEHVDGPATAADVVVTDALAPALAFVSATGGGSYDPSDRSVTWNLDPIPPGATRTVELTADIDGTFSGDLDNTARVRTSTRDGDPANDVSTVSTSVSRIADVAVEKSGPATATAGSTITYSIVARHAGGSGTATDVVVTDALPTELTFESASSGGSWEPGSRTVTWALGALAVGDESSLMLTAGVPAGATGTVVNRVSVTTTSSDPVPGNNDDAATTVIPKVADLALSKSAPAVDTAGSQMAYDLTVRHVGGPDAAEDVVVTDPLPSGVTFVAATDGGTSSGGVVTWHLGGLAVGSSKNVTVTVAIKPNTIDEVVNSASVSAASTDPDPSNNGASASTTVVQVADLSIEKSGPGASVPQLTEFSYTIRVANDSGPSSASGVTIVDVVPPMLTFVSASGGGSWDATSRTVTWSVGALALGASASRTLTVRSGTGIGPVTNTASVTSASTDPNPDNDSADATLSVVVAADVSVTISAASTAAPGDTLDYAIVLTNNSAVPSQLGRLTGVLPSALAFESASDGGTPSADGRTVTWTDWPGGGLAAGASLTRHLVAIVASDATGDVSTTATVVPDTNDPDLSNNSRTAVTTISAPGPVPEPASSRFPAPGGAESSADTGVPAAGGGGLRIPLPPLSAEAIRASRVYPKGMMEQSTRTPAHPTREDQDRIDVLPREGARPR